MRLPTEDQFDNTARTIWREILARKYPTEAEARQFIDQVGMRPEQIAFQPRADLTWFSILEQARKQGGNWVYRILDQALADFPDDEALARLRIGQHVGFPDGQTTVWRGPTGAQLEKLISDEPTLVPVSFLEKGILCAKAVVRLRRGNVFGSGFLIEDDLLVTNNHVIPDEAAASATAAEFNYQRTIDGLLAPIQSFGCDPGALFITSGSAIDDFTIVKLHGQPTKVWPPLRLVPVEVRGGDRVNVIQHPGGQEKQLSYFHNVVAFAGNGRVQYLTDTLPGSSGSPVFDREWRVVAVHHSGGWLPEPALSKRNFFRNEGIDINLVIKALSKGAV